MRILAQRIFIEGLTGMAHGLFATLIIGTILVQIGTFIPGGVGETVIMLGKVAQSITGAGIGIGAAYRLKSSTFVLISAGVAGQIGALAAGLLAGTTLVSTDSGTALQLTGPGEPLGAFIAAYVAIEVGRVVSGKTPVDILVTPLTTIIAGGGVGLLVGPPISSTMRALGNVVNWGTERQPFVMGIIVAVIMGIVLTLPISSAALGIILGLSGLAAGAATIGCVTQMVGFAAASFRENRWSGVLAQGLGTSMLQVPNIVRHPLIWIPPTLASAILGPVSSVLLHMESNAVGSGMGSAGLVGQIMTWNVMGATTPHLQLAVTILLFHFVAPALLTLGISEFMRKQGWIKPGDMALPQA
ncbi:PTS sugar transporter subunit IIC [Schaalia sp. ZJ405]|nr:PTS sugar transporter subunit IIC [Schaalia sp. ZJ405]